MSTPDVTKFTLVDRPVSQYVIEILDLKVGDQKNLIGVRRLPKWKNMDQVMVVARGWLESNFRGVLHHFKFCFDAADQTVYSLLPEDISSDCFRAYFVHVFGEELYFYKVSSIVVRKNSFRDFIDMDIRIKGNRSDATLDVGVVSSFVLQYFHLDVGDQSRVLAVKDLTCDNKMKLVARVVRQNRGTSFLSTYKFALDGMTGIMYVLVLDADEAELMTGRSFLVDGQDVCFLRVLKLEKRDAPDDLFQSGYCTMIWPRRRR